MAKGHSLLNNILGILLSFREDRFAYVGDISKMFHSISVPIEDQMTHLFLWRDIKTDKKPSTYAITAVNMGDRPASAIAQTALKLTANQAQEKYPRAAQSILQNAYMDDIPGSEPMDMEGEQIMEDITILLKEKNFNIKEWIFSGQERKQGPTETQRAIQALMKAENEETTKVLGIAWDTRKDKLKSMEKSLKEKKERTKRECLSTIYSIYDPVGLLTPVTVAAKIILRKIWSVRPLIEWDNALP